MERFVARNTENEIERREDMLMSTESCFADEVKEVEEFLGSENVETRGEDAVDVVLR